MMLGRRGVALLRIRTRLLCWQTMDTQQQATAMAFLICMFGFQFFLMHVSFLLPTSGVEKNTGEAAGALVATLHRDWTTCAAPLQ